MNKAFPLESNFFDKCTVWAFRISNVEGLNLQKTFDGFLEFGPDTYPERLIVSEETSSKGVLHHHGLITMESIDKNKLTDIIKKIYPDAKGNKSIYTAQALKKNQLIKYTIKEGLYLQRGFSTDFLNVALKLSSSKEGMEKAFTDLLDSLKLDQITFKQYISGYLKLKVDHNQPLYSNHLIAYFRTIYFKTTGSLDPYVDSLYNKIIFSD